VSIWIGESLTTSIPEPNRLYVCACVDRHFLYESTELPRITILRLFEGLVTKLLSEKGFRETIGKEETSNGSLKHRNVYDDRIHLEAFQECFRTLPLHFPLLCTIQRMLSRSTNQSYHNGSHSTISSCSSCGRITSSKTTITTTSSSS
jgi:hypothetical protein